MDAEFWRARWRSGAIGFHLADVNALLAAHWSSVAAQGSGAVFAPLCGKSLDLHWLAARGHHVIGVELSALAVESFFTEAGLTALREPRGSFEVSTAGPIEIWCGDYFDLPPERFAIVAWAYDRASLIALPPSMRLDYARQFARLMPAGSHTLLITLTHDLGVDDGPPFSVTAAEVERLYGTAFRIERLETEDAAAATPNLVARGAKRIENTVFRLARTGARE